MPGKPRDIYIYIYIFGDYTCFFGSAMPMYPGEEFPGQNSRNIGKQTRYRKTKCLSLPLSLSLRHLLLCTSFFEAGSRTSYFKNLSHNLKGRCLHYTDVAKEIRGLVRRVGFQNQHEIMMGVAKPDHWF